MLDLKPVSFSTTKIAKYVSSCSSPVPSPALCVVPSDQCDGIKGCPSFDESVGGVLSVLCVCLCGVSNMHALVVREMSVGMIRLDSWPMLVVCVPRVALFVCVRV